ncbi:MAG: tRNA (adenosine(37)-N6)-threonylcarbamoyltransferase complex dimerization subunit type 1 TsaB [Magnetococcus sp. DMHC-6]
MNILAMDSSSTTGSLAFLTDGEVVFQTHFQSYQGHIVHLSNALKQLFATSHCTPKDLDLIVVTLGPGSFVGLRVTLGLAKGICLAHGRPLVGVDTLTALAVGARKWGAPLRPLVAVTTDAQRGDLFVAIYQVSATGLLQPLLEPTLCSMQGFIERLFAYQARDPAFSPLFLGSGLAANQGALLAVLGDRFLIAPEIVWQMDPVSLALYGYDLWRQQGPSSLDHLEPLYLRPSDAQRKIF